MDTVAFTDKVSSARIAVVVFLPVLLSLSLKRMYIHYMYVFLLNTGTCSVFGVPQETTGRASGSRFMSSSRAMNYLWQSPVYIVKLLVHYLYVNIESFIFVVIHWMINKFRSFKKTINYWSAIVLCSVTIHDHSSLQPSSFQSPFWIHLHAF